MPSGAVSACANQSGTRALVLQTFKVSRFGMIAGCRILSGSIERSHRIRVIREQSVLNDSAAEPRVVVSQEGPGRPILLSIYDAGGEVASVVLSPVRALGLAKELIEPAVAEIKFQQWGPAE